MNDHEAIDAINKALDKWADGDESEFATLFKISYITGLNEGSK